MRKITVPHDLDHEAGIGELSDVCPVVRRSYPHNTQYNTPAWANIRRPRFPPKYGGTNNENGVLGNIFVDNRSITYGGP